MIKKILVGMWLAGFALAGETGLGQTQAQAVPGLSAEHNAILSKLQSMGHGYYTAQEWSEVDGMLDQLLQDCLARQDGPGYVDAVMIKAMVLSDMRHMDQAAIQLLQDARRRVAAIPGADAQKLYVKEAEVFGKLGDQPAVARLIKEYRASPYYKPEAYPFDGGQGREVPLTVVRPAVGGNDAISLTAMENVRQQANVSAGALFPEFSVTDLNGQAISLASLAGKVVLVDFWMQDWRPWLSALPQLVSTYERYHAQGFEIVGVNMDPAPAGLAEFLQKQGMRWPQALSDKSMEKKLGIFGEAKNYLLDQNGMVIGINLRNQDLVVAVRRALGIQ